MKRKLLAVLMAAAMVTGLAACGGGNAAPASAASSAAPAKAESAAPAEEKAPAEAAAPAEEKAPADGELPYVAISLPPAENAWQANFAEMLEAKMKDAESAEVLTYTLKSSQDAADQMNVLQTFKDDPTVDFIVVLPVDGAQLTATVGEIYDAGIPVIVCDRDISSDKKTAFVAGDNYGCGVAAAEYIEEFFADQDEVKYVNLRSYAGTEIDLARFNGFNDTISKNEKFINIGEADGEFNSTAGFEAMSNLLAANDQIDLVYTHDDETTTGALTAIIQEGRTDIKLITGMGGTVTSLREIAEDSGPHKMTAAYFPADMAEIVIDAILNYAETGSMEKEILFKSYAITKDNVDQFQDKAYE